MSEMRFEKVAPMRVIGMRLVGPYAKIGRTWKHFTGWLKLTGNAKLFGAPGVLSLSVFWDDPASKPEKELRSDAALSLPAGCEVRADAGAGVVIREMEGGEFAIIRHKGPYEGLPEAWKAFSAEALQASGREPAPGYCYEVYLNDPAGTAPEDLETDLYVRVKPA
jgi:AraC family transcriptional regulator